MLWAILLAGVLLQVPALAAVSVDRPIAQQLPQIARPNTPYSWAFAENTFHSDQPGHTLYYQVQGLPRWATFDNNTRSISGTPGADDVGSMQVNVVAFEEGGSPAESSFTLLTLAGSGPKLNKPLPEQLPLASSLGAGSILPGGEQHLPLGWSFSIGFAGDTFTSESGSIWVAAKLADGSNLPEWLTFDPTMTVWGVAPTNVGPQGERLEVVITASERANYSGVSSSFFLVTSSETLTMSTPLQPVNVTAGASFEALLPTQDLLLDGRDKIDPASVQVMANISTYPWISYDERQKQLSGTPPFDFPGDSLKSVQIPLRYSDSQNHNLTTNFTINVFPAPFTVEKLPDVKVESGKRFTVDLGEYVREESDGKRSLDASIEPSSARSWVKFDQDSLQLSGQPPENQDLDRVKVTLTAPSPSQRGTNSTSTASFFLQPQDGGSSPTETTNESMGDDQAKSGLSRNAKIGIAASVGAVGGLALMILLLMCCRRCCAAEDHDTSGRQIDYDTSGEDDRTLTEGKSPTMGFGWKGSPKSQKWRKGSAKEHASPYLNALNSPFSDAHTLAAESPNPAVLTAVRLDNGGNHDGVNARSLPPVVAEQPRKSAMLGFLKRKSASGRSLVRDATFNSANLASSGSIGLGLEGMGAPSSDNPYADTRRGSLGHSRSLARSSWESDIWKNDGSRPSSRLSQLRDSMSSGSDTRSVSGHRLGVDSTDEVPVRRGGAGPMRHRNAHINASPAFNLGQGFDSHASVIDRTDRDSQTSRVSNRWEGFETIDEAQDPEEAADAVVAHARRVNVEPSGTVLTRQPISIEPKQRDKSQHIDEVEDAQSAFEDAETEPEYVDQVYQRHSTRNTTADRGSKASYMPGLDGTDISAVRFSDSYRDSIRLGTSQPPNMKAEETVRVVPASNTPLPPTPLFPSASIASNEVEEPAQRQLQPQPQPEVHQTRVHGRTSSVSSTGTKSYQREQHVTVVPGELIRVKALSASQAPPIIGGAPGSPGKRSGKRLNYMPVLQDEKYMEYWGTRPDFLEWLSWDSRMHELSGTVPPRFGPTPLSLRIAIMAKPVYTPQQGAPNSSPGKRHSRQSSIESTGTSVEEEVVAIVILHIQKASAGPGAGSTAVI